MFDRMAAGERKRMANLYYDNSADLSLIQAKKVAIIGYGSQGHAHALNLRDSGVSVRVGLPEGSASRAKAEKAGLTVHRPAEAAAWAEVIMILVPDTKQPKLYREAIEPNLKPGKTLMFAHGFNIRFGTIKPGFETLTEAGYQPGVAYFECLHELELIVDLIYRGGLSYMRYSVSDTAEQGDYCAGPRIITEQTREEMRNILTEIRNGRFAKAWIEENEKGCPNFLATRQREQQHSIEQLGPKLRAMMPFLQPVIAPGLENKAAASKK